ncbi:MAG: diaminopimelate decarboxylase [Bacillota bacterium]|nr:diaminopimelate decarboxylase [Bacillota bacterium]
MTNYVSGKVTLQSDFFCGTNPIDLIEEYGSPLYVYNEKILRSRCRELRSLLKYPRFQVQFSAKANSNLTLLQIVREEGLKVDAMSPGEIYIQMKAGFSPEDIFYVCNNVSADEMKFAVERGITVSVDSVSQLELFGKVNPGGKVAVRFNPGVGAGHNEKVVTAGKRTKFGVDPELINEIKDVLNKYDLKVVGINQHIGSLFMEGKPYLDSVKALLDIAGQFSSLEFIDMGGGFGVPYHKQQGEERLDLEALGIELDKVIAEWVQGYGREITIKVEPGRYVVAESGIILGTVHTVKNNYGKKYIGTDIGFNVLARPVMYNSHHDIEVYRKSDAKSAVNEPVTVVGNICESGDIIAKERLLPEIFEEDIIGILDCGAYGCVMSSNYNSRLRPAEILIRKCGEVQVIRRRDTLEDLVRNF